MILFIVFMLSLVTTYFLTKSSVLDIPVHRSSHKDPTPRIGGIALLVSMGSYLLLSFNYTHFELERLWVGLALLSVAGIGLIDDIIKGVSYKIRLLVQVIAAIFLLKCFGPVPFFQEYLTTHLGGEFCYYLTSSITVLLIVFQINALNFSDGFNGQLGGSLLVACFGLHLNQFNPLGIVDALFVSLIGFLCFNIRGKIFLGDVGSTFLGCFFAAITLYGANISSTPVRTWFGLNAILAFLWADVILTLFKRLLIRARLTDPRRDYLSHLLNRTGFRHRHIAVFYTTATFLCSLTLINVIKDDASFWNWIFWFCLLFLSFSGYVYKRALDQSVEI